MKHARGFRRASPMRPCRPLLILAFATAGLYSLKAAQPQDPKQIYAQIKAAFHHPLVRPRSRKRSVRHHRQPMRVVQRMPWGSRSARRCRSSALHRLVRRPGRLGPAVPSGARRRRSRPSADQGRNRNPGLARATTFIPAPRPNPQPLALQSCRPLALWSCHPERSEESP